MFAASIELLMFLSASDSDRPSHMTRLFEICKAPKVWRELPNGSHNDTVAEAGYFSYIDEFLREYVES